LDVSVPVNVAIFPAYARISSDHRRIRLTPAVMNVPRLENKMLATMIASRYSEIK
jgi:hypothetical protein